jgi:hydroxypyruvate isomerase
MLMKAVRSPSCKMLYDLYHSQINEGHLIYNFDKCFDEIAYVQTGTRRAGRSRARAR